MAKMANFVYSVLSALEKYCATSFSLPWFLKRHMLLFKWHFCHRQGVIIFWLLSRLFLSLSFRNKDISPQEKKNMNKSQKG